MNKMNKKGFTIVELVIVIAVIAILAGVLIPTFGGIIERANESAELQKVTSAYKNVYANALANDGKITDADFDKEIEGEGDNATVKSYYKVEGDYRFTYDFTAKTWGATNTKSTEYTYACDANGAWTVTTVKAAN